MKGLVCLLLLLETFVFVDGGLNENEISQQLSSADRRQNPPQTDTLRDEASADSQQNSHLGFPDIHAALRELSAMVTEQKEDIRALETRLRDEIKKKTDETLSQVELRKENGDREIAFSASLMESGTAGFIGPFTTDYTLTFRNVFTNIGNDYNPTTGIFTAPLKGAYRFRISVVGSGPAPLTVSIVKNGECVVSVFHDQPQGTLNGSNGVLLILEVGDVISVRLWSGSKIYDNRNNYSTFSGFLLFPLI